METEQSVLYYEIRDMTRDMFTSVMVSVIQEGKLDINDNSAALFAQCWHAASEYVMLQRQEFMRIAEGRGSLG